MTIISTLSREDLYLWRRACARMEVARSGNPNISVDVGEEVWVDYYELLERLTNDYNVGPDAHVEICAVHGTIHEVQG